MPVNDNLNENPAGAAVPFADENAAPARRSALLESQRQASGGLSDDPIDNPVVDTNPVANLQGEGKSNA